RGACLEKGGIVLADHAGAGARRGYNIVIGRESVQHLKCYRSCISPVARIESGLATAGLCCWCIDFTSRAFEQLNRRETDGRSEQIDEAGYEKADAKRISGHQN